MTKRKPHPDTPTGRIHIATALNNSVQLFDDLDDDMIDALKEADLRTAPPVFSRDGILIEGNQRLRAAMRARRTWLSPDQYVVDDSVDQSNALEASLKRNLVRRHLTVEQKAALAVKLQKDRGYSQGVIAKLFGVSRPAVSQWLENMNREAMETTGLDGKKRKQSPLERKKAQDDLNDAYPWEPERGYLHRDITRLHRRLFNNRPERGALTDEEIVKVLVSINTPVANLEICRGILYEQVKSARKDIEEAVRKLETEIEDIGGDEVKS